MIAAFLRVYADTSGQIKIAFVDSQERSWFIACAENPSVMQLAAALGAATIMATNPEMAVALGIVSQAVVDEVTEARNKLWLARSLDEADVTKH